MNEINKNQEKMLNDLHNNGPKYLWDNFNDYKLINDVNELEYDFKFIHPTSNYKTKICETESKRYIVHTIPEYKITGDGINYIEHIKK